MKLFVLVFFSFTLWNLRRFQIRRRKSGRGPVTKLNAIIFCSNNFLRFRRESSSLLAVHHQLNRLIPQLEIDISFAPRTYLNSTEFTSPRQLHSNNLIVPCDKSNDFYLSRDYLPHGKMNQYWSEINLSKVIDTITPELILTECYL